MPFSLGYALFGDDGVHIIDPGSGGQQTLDRWAIFLADHGRNVSEIATIIVTHGHQDHLGAAAEMRAVSGARLVMSGLESRVLEGEGRLLRTAAQRADLLAAWGAPEAEREEMLDLLKQMDRAPNEVRADLLLGPGDTLQLAGHTLSTLVTPGHTAGHLCLMIEGLGVIFTGDHVLPQIIPGMGLGYLPGSNALIDYLTSLRAMRQFDNLEVLPGHEFRFTGLAKRSQQIAQHDLTRTRAVAALVPEMGGGSTWEYAERLPWSRGWNGMRGFYRYSALAQTNMHLEAVRSGQADEWL